MHLDDEQVQRFLHGELGGSEMVVRGHVGDCPECRSRLAAAEREEKWVFDRLQRLDHGQPRVSLESVVAANARRAPAWGRWVAGVFLALAAAGAAYAAPGSPLPRVIDHIIRIMTGAPERPVATSPVVAEPQVGIAVAPGSRLAIVFLGDESEGTATVALSDSADVIVRALGGTTTFTSDAERLTIGHQGAAAELEILIPRRAPFVEVRAGGRRILLKEGSRILADLQPDSQGRYLLRLPSSAP